MDSSTHISQITIEKAPPSELDRADFELVIEPAKSWPLPSLGEVWRYRHLLGMLVWRDFSARYRQSMIGVSWALIRPIVMVLVFTMVFGVAAGLPTNGIPYPAFMLAGLIPWAYFAGCLGGVSGSVIAGQGLLTKVYFPRLTLPLSNIVGGLVDFSIQFVLLAIVMLWYQMVPGWQLVLVIPLVLLAMMTALGCGLWLAALNVKYRDIGQAVPFLLQTWMWCTPVAYASEMIPERFRLIYSLNPMVAVVDGFRWATLGRGTLDPGTLSVSAGVALVLLISGLFFFAKTESTFADLV